MSEWSRVENLFHEARAKPPAERSAFLDQACSDAELRREVQSLLRSSEEAETFLESSPVSSLEAAPPRWTPGMVVGRFEIGTMIGAGGMGEVYRALDTSLHRDVAIKVLPARLAGDVERMRRFSQEARAAGMLNHPNILAVYEIGTHHGCPYVVSELLEGETLRHRMEQGALPRRKAVELGLQIARGLAAAHAKGVVHRDLKPENLFLTKDGHVKILDFGLAKLTQETAANREETATVSLSTTPGVVMGTVGYMPPEQIRGLPTDHRCDIFAFGVVLYEMLSGRRAFSGNTAADVMTATLKEEPPDLVEIDPGMPAGLAQVVRHCIEKRLEDRFESARDLAFALEAATGSSRNAAIPEQPAPPRRRRWRWAAAATAVVALAGTAVLLDRALRTPPAPAFEPITFRRGSIASARFGPDNRSVYYGAAWDGNPNEIFTAIRGNPESKPLQIPDSQLLAVSSAGEIALLTHPFNEVGTAPVLGTLARVPLTGGTPREIRNRVAYADWSPAGDRLLIAEIEGPGQGFKIEYPLGNVIFVQKGGWITSPRISPDGKAVAFFDHPPGSFVFGIATVVELGGKTARLGQWNTTNGLAWTPDSSEIWVAAGDTNNANAIYALSRSGKRRLIWRSTGNLTLHDIARDGQVLLSHDSTRSIAVGMFRDDDRERVISWLDGTAPAAFSPSGDALLFGEFGEGGGAKESVYLRKTDGSPAVRLGDGRPTSLSPDGKWALATLRNPPPQQVILLPTGVGDQAAVKAEGVQFTGGISGWLPDSRRFVLNGRASGSLRCYIVDVNELKPRELTPPSWSCRAVSPDGKLVVAMNPPGELQLFAVDGSAPHKVPMEQLGIFPVAWSTDPNVVYAFRGQQTYRVNLITGKAEPWKKLEPADRAGFAGAGGFTVTADGRYYAYQYLQVLSDLFVATGLR